MTLFLKMTLWEVTSSNVLRLRSLPPHGSPVLALDACFGRLVTRELAGDTKVWDIYTLLNREHAQEALNLEENSKAFQTRVALALSRRRLIMASMDCALLCYDVWS